MGVGMPRDIREDPVQRDVWRAVAPRGNGFTKQDVPTLRLLCFWHAVAREAQRQMAHGGRLAIFDPVALKPFTGPDGKAPLMVRKSPALAVLKEATSEIRALSDALGATPAARSRMGAEGCAAKADGGKAKLLASLLADEPQR